LLVALALPISVEAAASAYEKEIKPVLKERCYACHGALKQKAGLRVDTVAFIKEASVIASGDPEKSELVQRIRSNDEEERMPPEGHALTQVEVKAIMDWITAGALAPEGERPEDDPLEHWAFQKIERPDIPKVDDISHPVDALLAAKQKDRGVIPVAAVNRKLAIRRLYLDLIGLPPTRGQLEDNRPWEAIVDELLASPQHGERWARHWMDVWRYSDWYGLGAQLRYSQRHLWHWRDWIVESLNENAGYDSMVRAMLAGD
jgi:cytochrome c5